MSRNKLCCLVYTVSFVEARTSSMKGLATIAMRGVGLGILYSRYSKRKRGIISQITA